MALNYRAWVAESIAVFALVFFGTMAVTGAIDLLGNKTAPDAGGLWVISIAHGLAIMLMAFATGHISGGHINPAVTVAMMATKRLDAKNGAGYILFQLIGATVAAALHAAILPASQFPHTGAHGLNAAIGVTPATGFLVEVALTFFLLFVIFATAVDPRAPAGFAPLAIGLTICMIHLVGVPLTGASVNPARTFGPALVFGAWGDHWLYWAGPILGGLIAALLYDRVFLKKTGA
ncbi:MAG: MIP family channel protein [Halobacteria archaeon]